MSSEQPTPLTTDVRSRPAGRAGAGRLLEIDGCSAMCWRKGEADEPEGEGSNDWRGQELRGYGYTRRHVMLESQICGRG
jgi:hypothetical protein